LERIRGRVDPDGVERLTTQDVFDVLDVAQPQRTSSAARRLAGVMREVGWSPVRVRGLTRGGYLEQVRGYCRQPNRERRPENWNNRQVFLGHCCCPYYVECVMPKLTKLAASTLSCKPINREVGDASASQGRPSHIKYSEEERELAARAREVAGDQDILYHGTRYAQSILRTGALLCPECWQVSFTRSAEVAAYWALMERDDDEGVGSILVLNRGSLAQGYDLCAVPEVFWLSADRFHNEAEEEIRADLPDLSNHLLGIVSGQAADPSTRRTQLNRKRNAEIELRLQQLRLRMAAAWHGNGAWIVPHHTVTRSDGDTVTGSPLRSARITSAVITAMDAVVVSHAGRRFSVQGFSRNARHRARPPGACAAFEAMAARSWTCKILWTFEELPITRRNFLLLRSGREGECMDDLLLTFTYFIGLALVCGAFALSPIYPFLLFLKHSSAPAQKHVENADVEATQTEPKLLSAEDAPSIVNGWP
jgi:hypothetical protein